MEEGFDIYPCRIHYKIDLGLKTFLVVIVGNGISRYEYIDITRTKIANQEEVLFEEQRHYTGQDEGKVRL